MWQRRLAAGAISGGMVDGLRDRVDDTPQWPAVWFSAKGIGVLCVRWWKRKKKGFLCCFRNWRESPLELRGKRNFIERI